MLGEIPKALLMSYTINLGTLLEFDFRMELIPPLDVLFHDRSGRIGELGSNFPDAVFAPFNVKLTSLLYGDLNFSTDIAFFRSY